MGTENNGINVILSDKLNQIRKLIADKFLLGKFGADDFQDVVARLEQNLDPKSEFVYFWEKQNLEHVLRHGEAKDAIRLETAENQILWAAGLALVAQHREITKDWPQQNLGRKISDTKIWNQIKNSSVIESELYRFGHLVHSKSHKKGVKVKYGEPPDGYPGIGYYFDPQQNFVNIDLLWTLIIGTENARGAVLHELGHTVLTVSFSSRMAELATIMMAMIGQRGEKPDFRKIQDALNSGALPKEKRQEILEMMTEWQRRHLVFDELENNPVNRWVAKQSNLFSQDFGNSLSHIETVAIDAQGVSINASSKVLLDKEPTEVGAEAKIANTKRAIRMVFHSHNGLFEEWNEVCVAPELVTNTAASANAFDILVDLTGGDRGAENLVPANADEWRGKTHFSAKVQELAEARGRIADRVYDEYFAPLFKELDQEQEKQQQNSQSQDQQNDQSQDGKGENKQQQKKASKSEKNDQDKEKETGTEGKEDGKSETGKSKDDKDEEKEAGGDDKEDGKPESGKDESEGKDKEESNQQPGDEQNQGQGNKEDKGWQSQIGEKEEKSAADDSKAGDMFDNPSMARAIIKGLGKITPQQIETELTAEELEALYQEVQEEQKPENENLPNVSITSPAPELQEKDTPPTKQLSPPVPQIVTPVHLKDWENSSKIKEGLEWAINQMAEKIWHIQRKSYQRDSASPDPKTIEMRDGDLRVTPQGRGRNSFDINAHRHLRELRRTGGHITPDDYRRFTDSVPVLANNRAGNIKKIAQIDVVTLIDGSDSMYWVEDARDPNGYREPIPGENVPIEAGLTGACIFHEACRVRRVNSFIGLWGSGAGQILTTPRSGYEEIRENIASIRSARGWGTSLEPAFRNMVETVAAQRTTKWDKIGCTHFIIISDGDIQDMREAYLRIATVLAKCPLTTVDFAVITENKDNTTAQLADTLMTEFPKRVGVQIISDIKTSVKSLLDLMSNRVFASLEVEAIAKQQKSGMLREGAK